MMAPLECFRIPLSYDKQTPFLKHSVITSKSLETFSWSNVFLGNFLHKSELIEIGPRGIRFIFHHDKQLEAPSIVEKSEKCKPTDLALCQADEGWVLPSEGKWKDAVFKITSDGRLLQDAVLRLLANETACHGENQGVGRAYCHFNSSQKPQYSITSCDILQGKYIIVYVKSAETVLLYSQTFGPIAYFLVLISATISTGAIAYLSKAPLQAKKNSEVVVVVVMTEVVVVKEDVGQRFVAHALNINACSSIIVCAAIFFRHKIQFHTDEDALVFWASVISGLIYSILVLQSPDSPFQIDACMYALETISIALYRSPENPYSFILSLFMACRIWEKYFLLCHGRNQHFPLSSRYLDVILALVNFHLICEIGVKPQYMFQEIWPFYFTMILFLTYCLVKYQWMMAITVV